MTNIKTITISVVISLALFLLLSQTRVVKFGSSVTETASSDTLETFRTNVNASLTSLQSFASSTSFTTGTVTANSASIGGSATTTITTAGKVGIASTTPYGSLGIGTASATSTISGGNLCWYFQDEADRGMYIKLSTSGSTVFSTSTTSCF